MINTHITGMDWPDPDVIRVGDTYYMASTTMYFFPGGAILKSFDLVHWEMASYVFDNLDGTDGERLENGKNIYGKGMWAPSLRYFGGTFYLAFVSHGVEDTHLFTATDIKGPWAHHKIKGYYHDCSLLFDEGHIYIAYGNTEIHITELKSDLSEPLPGGLDTVILKDDREQVILGYEGSHLYKINGKYIITLIHWPKESMRTQAVFVSDRIEGPYQGGDCLSDEYVIKGMGVAQGGLIETPEGDVYAMLFRDSGAVGRIPVLVPVNMDTDIPVYGDNGKMPAEFELKTKSIDYSYSPLIPRVFGEQDANGQLHMNLNWQWNHVPDNCLWELKDERTLRIKSGQISVNPLWAKNTCTVRTAYPTSEITIVLQTDGLKCGDTAGILLLQGNYAMLGINKDNDGLHAVVYQSSFEYEGYSIGCEDRVPPKEIYRSDAITGDNEFTLSVKTNFTDMKDEAVFFVNNSPLPLKPFKMKFTLELFTGVRFGMCLMSTAQIGGEADFILL